MSILRGEIFRGCGTSLGVGHFADCPGMTTYDRANMIWFGSMLTVCTICLIWSKLGIPYWIILQHGYEDFFLADERAIEAVAEISTAARRFIFIAKRNQ